MREAAFAFLVGELGDTVTPEDTFESHAGLVPDLTGRAERSFGYIADTTRRTAGRTDLTVQNLHDVQHRHFFGRHGETVASVSTPAAGQHVRPSQIPEDLLQKTLRYLLAACDLCDPHRGAAFAQRQLHQRPHSIFTLLRKSQIEIHLLLM